MLRRSSSLIALCLLCLSVPALAQKAPTITVGSNKSAPGSEVSVDLSVAGAEAANSSSATLTIQFPRSGLSFIRTESAVPGVTVESKMLPEGPKPEIGVVEVTIKLAPDATIKALPDLTVGQAVFVVSADAKPETKIPLTAEATPKSVTTVNGEITVVPSLIFSCFFYMH